MTLDTEELALSKGAVLLYREVNEWSWGHIKHLCSCTGKSLSVLPLMGTANGIIVDVFEKSPRRSLSRQWVIAFLNFSCKSLSFGVALKVASHVKLG